MKLLLYRVAFLHLSQESLVNNMDAHACTRIQVKVIDWNLSVDICLWSCVM